MLKMSGVQRYLLLAGILVLGMIAMLKMGIFATLVGVGYNQVPDLQVPKFEGSLEDKMLDYYYGTVRTLEYGDSSADLQVFALHGMANNQSSESWIPLAGMMKDMGGAFTLVDAPGFGKSHIGSWFLSVPQDIAGLGLYEVLKAKGLENGANGKKVVIIARGWGADVIMMLFRNFEQLRKEDYTYILIAPTTQLRNFYDFLKAIFARADGIIIWAANDPKIPKRYMNIIHRYMPKMKQVTLARISSHYPEQLYPGLVSNAILEWWNNRQ